MTPEMASSSVFIILCLLFVPTLTGCQTPTSPNRPYITDIWTRPYQAGAGLTTAIYLTIHNPTPAAIQLIGASTMSSDTVEIHQSALESGIMRMRPVSALTLAPESSLSFEPGQHHLMVKGLQRSLASGDSLTVTFRFSNGEAVPAVAHVKWELAE